MIDSILETISYLHDANVDNIQIKQVSFSRSSKDNHYPKDIIDIEMILSLPVLENSNFSERQMLCICTDVENFVIQKTDKWEWLIYEVSIEKADTWYEFKIDDYIFLRCKFISYKLL